MKIATAAYQPQWHPTWDALHAKLDAWVAEARARGAELAVFPEYAGIEAALIGTPGADPGPVAWRDAMAARAEDWVALHSTLAQRHGITLLAGSVAQMIDGAYVNAAHLCLPIGAVGTQSKIIPTPYERRDMQITGGDALTLFDTPLGRIGILICYDSEFPLLARQLISAGADMILVPSCTEFPAGQTRVRQSARARAIEGQCLIVQAPLVGNVPDCDVVNVNTGRAGVFCPPDYGLPPDGIITQGDTDVAGWTYATVDPAQIAQARKSGQVGNYADWPMQTGVTTNLTAL